MSARALEVALEAALLGDAGVVAMVGASGVYASPVPSSAVLPYVEIGDHTQVEFARFGASGERSPITLHCWAARRDLALGLFDAVKDALHRRALAGIAGGRVSLVTTQEDADGRAVQCVARYEADVLG